jgi:hypothetical protein
MNSFVVGGCTGIFPGCGWDCVSPMSEKYRRPSVSIAVAGTYSGSIQFL